MTQSFDSERAPAPVGNYPHSRKAGSFLYLSGVGPRSRGTSEIPGVTLSEGGQIISYDIEAQCHSVFSNVRHILEASGAAWEDLIDITVFLTDMKNDFSTFNRVYASYFSDHQPCRTTVEVNALPTPIAIELKCIAYLGE
jgi:2-aminomuconate deaminase